MSKKKNNNKKSKQQRNNESRSLKQVWDSLGGQDDGLLRPNRSSSVVEMLPIILFTAVTILIVRMHAYSRPMSQFVWTPQNDDTQLSDFFSYDKAVFILILAVIAILIFAYDILTGEIKFKKTRLYIPIVIYSFFVILSFVFCDYKIFSIMGYNDRFEGTIPLLCYMIMLVFVINFVNSEHNVRMILYALSIATVVLGFIGLSQGLGKDIFKTELVEKLITPNYRLSDDTTVHQAISQAFASGEQYYNFAFADGKIYQTVYNINYVSFYLTLLIPLFGMLFIRSFNLGKAEKLWKKIALAAIFALVIYNFIGSSSSGGLIGVAVFGILGNLILNKQLLKFWKPLLILFAEAGIILALTAGFWMSEFKFTLYNVFGISLSSQSQTVSETHEDVQTSELEPGSQKPWLDYMLTTENGVSLGINGNDLLVELNGSGYIEALDGEGNALTLASCDDDTLSIEDTRFRDYIKFCYAVTEDGDRYIILYIGGTQMSFICYDNCVMYVNEYGNEVELSETPESAIFTHNLTFGTKRGYIWSRSIPLLKDTILIGKGADTFCINFPQTDYAGRYNTTTEWMSTIIDKPHNMYLNTGLGTGIISLIALLSIYITYIVSSIKLYWKRDIGTDLVNVTGIGIFFGTTAFMATGLVDDSSVSVMPMFYGLLGTGIAINMMIARRDKKSD